VCPSQAAAAAVRHTVALQQQQAGSYPAEEPSLYTGSGAAAEMLELMLLVLACVACDGATLGVTAVLLTAVATGAAATAAADAPTAAGDAVTVEVPVVDVDVPSAEVLFVAVEALAGAGGSGSSPLSCSMHSG
jgi:hypothetical protein